MNWKFWKRERPIGQKLIDASGQNYAEWRKAAEEKAAADKAQAKAEWDALPDHRKAARIEFQYFQQMARKPPSGDGLYQLALAQQQGLLSSGSISMYSPYAQMNNEIGRVMWLEKGGFL